MNDLAMVWQSDGSEAIRQRFNQFAAQFETRSRSSNRMPGFSGYRRVQLRYAGSDDPKQRRFVLAYARTLAESGRGRLTVLMMADLLRCRSRRAFCGAIGRRCWRKRCSLTLPPPAWPHWKDWGVEVEADRQRISRTAACINLLQAYDGEAQSLDRCQTLGFLTKLDGWLTAEEAASSSGGADAFPGTKLKIRKGSNGRKRGYGAARPDRMKRAGLRWSQPKADKSDNGSRIRIRMKSMSRIPLLKQKIRFWLKFIWKIRRPGWLRHSLTSRLTPTGVRRRSCLYAQGQHRSAAGRDEPERSGTTTVRADEAAV